MLYNYRIAIYHNDEYIVTVGMHVRPHIQDIILVPDLNMRYQVDEVVLSPDSTTIICNCTQAGVIK